MFCCVFVLKTTAQNNMSFIENKGQWLDNVQFKSELAFGDIYFEKDNFTFILIENEAHNHNSLEHDDAHEELIGHHFKIKFLNANENVTFSQGNQSGNYYNYFLGNSQKYWASHVHSYKAITYHNLYQGIDMKVEGEEDNMKYEYYVEPFAEPSNIQVKYEGIDDLKIKNGNLIYSTSIAGVTELKPVVYQLINEQKIFIKCEYDLNKKTKTVQFNLLEDYDESIELVIDPTLVFASYTGSTLNNFGFTATYDDDGNLFGGGIIYGFNSGLTGYPSINSFNLVDSTTGSNASTFNNGFPSDIAISKYSSDGTTLLYSTLIGGSNNEQPQSLITDTAGNLYIYARTFSSDFPVDTNAYDTSFGGNSDIVIIKIADDGGTLMGSTFIGGANADGVNMYAHPGVYGALKYNYADDGRGEIILDEDGNVYVASSTQSNNIFPGSTSFQMIGGGLQDACVFKLNNDLSSLIWGSYLGGSNIDAGYSLKLDNLGSVFVSGGTNSIDFPNTMGGLNPNYLGGQADGFLSKIDTNGTVLNQSTYIGSSSYDQSFFIEIDEFNDVFTYGQTTGSYPVTTGVYSNANSSQFIHKLNNDLNLTEFSTVFGSGDSVNVNISPTAFLVDYCGNIYISGWGGSTNNSPNNPNATGFTIGMPVTSNAFQSTTDGSDFYFMVLEKGAQSLLYGTYYGGNQTVTGGSGEHVDGGTSRFDKNGVIYQAVCASCGAINNNFPTTAGAWSQIDSSAGSGCNLGVIKMDVYIPPTIVYLDASPTATGCVPLTVNFYADLVNVNLITWDFGDGNFSNMEDPIHTFTDTGTFVIRLIGEDTTLCNLADTAFLTVIVEDDSLKANFIDNAIIDCYNSSVSLVTENYPTTQYLWTMGDGNIYITDSVYHEYLNPGDYLIKLLITDSTSCEFMDSTEAMITILPVFDVSFAISDTFACIPLVVNFNNLTNMTVDSFFWDFGDGNTSILQSPSNSYSNVGSYQVQLFALDSNTCNLTDTAIAEVVTVNDRIDAQIQMDTLFYDCDSLVLRFSALNDNISSYNWNFDNGIVSSDSTIVVSFIAGLVPSPSIFNVSYIVTDTNLVCKPIDTAGFQIRLKPEFVFNATISDSSGCLPLQVFFSAAIDYPMDSFIWNFGDGNTAEVLNVNYTFSMEGNYNASFLVYDTNTCNITDSIYFPIQVENDVAFADVSVVENLFHCDSLQIYVHSNSINVVHFWDFGDGTISLDSATSHTFSNEGIYTISYIIYDSTKACNPYDTAFYQVDFESFQADLQISDTIGCIPLILNYTSSSIGQSYFWNFGNGDNSITQTGYYTFVNTGTFTISVLIEDTFSCNVWDTAYAQITTENTRVEALADLTVLNDCDSLLSIQIDNQSVNGNTYEWLFDGASLQTLEEPGNIDFTTVGNHTIQLIVRNDSLCNPIDTFVEYFNLLPNTTAYFYAEGDCVEASVFIENGSSLGATFNWNFGNGNTSILQNPSIEYNESGLYVISLTVVDSNSCNVINTFTNEINIIDKAVANFITDSINYIYPDDVYFTNLSQNYTNFNWEFGDGNSDVENEDPVHSYKILYDITPCLSVWNVHCIDSICKNIYIDFIELIGVPNAFSPNEDGVNDIIYVEGEGIEKLNFKIYNRWGILVFESDDQSIGWDGTYNGAKQELEVYTYIVDALFLNEKSVVLKGNITLMR